jgi:hypothetical protein
VKKLYKRNLWLDTTTDYKSGHYVGKDVVKVLSFLFAMLLAICKVLAMWISNKDLGVTDLIALFLGTGVGLATTKMFDNFYRRRTSDNQGNPLTVPIEQTDEDTQAPYPLANPNENCPKPPVTTPGYPACSP